MTDQMSQFKATANVHMRSAVEAGRKWDCACEACGEIRSLMGMEKTLEMRPLVREIQALENRLDELQEGEEKSTLRERYLTLYDQLAAVMAK